MGALTWLFCHVYRSWEPVPLLASAIGLGGIIYTVLVLILVPSVRTAALSQVKARYAGLVD
jgi:hypothetical protein